MGNLGRWALGSKAYMSYVVSLARAERAAGQCSAASVPKGTFEPVRVRVRVGIRLKARTRRAGGAVVIAPDGW